MDWELAITRHRDALLRMLAALLVMAGDGAGVPRHVYEAVLRVLRPAESAFRRLIVIYMQVRGVKARYVPRAASAVPVNVPRGAGARVPSFALFDPRKRVGFQRLKHPAGPGPRIWEPGMDYPVFETKTVPLPDDPVDATRLCKRMLALQNALGDLPKQARRLARVQAKREAARGESGKYIRAIRPGRPPGHRARWTHPVDDVLRESHALALYLLHPPDT